MDVINHVISLQIDRAIEIARDETDWGEIYDLLRALKINLETSGVIEK